MFALMTNYERTQIKNVVLVVVLLLSNFRSQRPTGSWRRGEGNHCCAESHDAFGEAMKLNKSEQLSGSQGRIEASQPSWSCHDRFQHEAPVRKSRPRRHTTNVAYFRLKKKPKESCCEDDYWLVFGESQYHKNKSNEVAIAVDLWFGSQKRKWSPHRNSFHDYCHQQQDDVRNDTNHIRIVFFSFDKRKILQFKGSTSISSTTSSSTRKNKISP